MIEYGGPNWGYSVYLTDLREDVPYIVMDQTENGIVRLLPEGETFDGYNSFNIELNKLKFLIENNLIHIKGFKITVAGKLALVKDYENKLDLDELHRLKRLIHQDEIIKQQKIKEEIRQQRQLAELEKQKQQEKEERIGKIPVIGSIVSLMNKFSEPPSKKVSTQDESISSKLLGDMTYNAPNLGARHFNRGLINILGSEEDKKRLQQKYK